MPFALGRSTRISWGFSGLSVSQGGLGRRRVSGGASSSAGSGLRLRSAKPANPNITSRPPATISQCGYCITKPPGVRHFFPFSPAPDFRETPNFFAVRTTLSGVRFSSAATASSDFNDAASCIKRRSSAKDQRVLAFRAITVSLPKQSKMQMTSTKCSASDNPPTSADHSATCGRGRRVFSPIPRTALLRCTKLLISGGRCHRLPLGCCFPRRRR